METTIQKTVKGSTMEAIFDKCDLFSVRHFIGKGITEINYNPSENYIYTIRIRHEEGTDANVLFEEARFRHEILSGKIKN